MLKPPLLTVLGWICVPGGIALARSTGGVSFLAWIGFGLLIICVAWARAFNVRSAAIRADEWRRSASAWELWLTGAGSRDHPGSFGLATLFGGCLIGGVLVTLGVLGVVTGSLP